MIGWIFFINYFRISALLAGLTDSLAAMIVSAAPGLEISRNMLALFASLSPLTVLYQSDRNLRINLLAILVNNQIYNRVAVVVSCVYGVKWAMEPGMDMSMR